ncbi:MAG: hypothetical protein GY930_07660 [bacterium]|nr:hypothetical protein [bacterium]
MVHRSYISLLVAALFGFASCGTTELAAAKHKEFVPTTVLLAVSSVEVLSSSDKDLEVTAEPVQDGLVEGIVHWGGERKDVDLTTPNFLSKSEIIIDLGVGQAPYDDGFFDYAMDFSPLVGFSDALMQLEYRAHIQPGTSVFGIAAINRVQDETIIRAMGQNDWAWVAMGVQFSW